MRPYPPIAEHGLIGDLQTCALVSSEGVLNWFCSPRFDAPSVFAALLDHDRGGYFAITADPPAAAAVVGGPGSEARVITRQLYLADTAVLITRFLTREGVGEVVDFMPVRDPHTVTDRHQVVRVLRTVRGSVRFALESPAALRLRTRAPRPGPGRRHRPLRGTRHHRTPAGRRPPDAGGRGG